MGAAAGIDRIIVLMKDKAIRFPKGKKPKIFLAQIGNLAKRKSLKLTEEFRKAKIPIAEFLGRDSLRAQLKMADRLGMKYALILGQKEALEGAILIRDMKTGKQKTVKVNKIIKRVKRLLK